MAGEEGFEPSISDCYLNVLPLSWEGGLRTHKTQRVKASEVYQFPYLPMSKTTILANKSVLEAAAKSSNSIKECLMKLGLRCAGGNYRQLKHYCNLYNIPVPKATGNFHTQKARDGRTIPLGDILVENSTYSNRTQIKKRCYRAGLLKEQCDSCGIGPEWNGSSLTLQLEHINGVFNDHRIENLRILCPNCHSQTETYCGKNR